MTAKSLRWFTILAVILTLTLAACSVGGDDDDDVAGFDIDLCGNTPEGFVLNRDASLTQGECVWVEVEEDEPESTSTEVVENFDIDVCGTLEGFELDEEASLDREECVWIDVEPESTSTEVEEEEFDTSTCGTREGHELDEDRSREDEECVWVRIEDEPDPEPSSTPEPPPAEAWSHEVTVSSRDKDGELVNVPAGNYQVHVISGEYWTGTETRTVVFVSSDASIEYCTEWNEPCPTNRDHDHYVGRWGTHEYPPRTVYLDGDIRIVTVDDEGSYEHLNEGSVTVEIRHVD